MTPPLTTAVEIQAAMQAGHGQSCAHDGAHYVDEGLWEVRVRHYDAHPRGWAETQWWGAWPPRQAEAVARVLQAEYGGTISVWQRIGAVEVVSTPGTGRTPVGPLVTWQMPRALISRMVAALPPGGTRTQMIIAGAEAIVAGIASSPDPADLGGELVAHSARLPAVLVERLEVEARLRGVTRAALLRAAAAVGLEPRRYMLQAGCTTLAPGEHLPG